MQLADYGSEDEIPSYRLEARNHSASDTYYEPVAVDSSSTLLETLMSQLAEHDLDDTQLTVAQYVIGNLDDNGYLRRDVGSMSYDIESQTGVMSPPVRSGRCSTLCALSTRPESGLSTCATAC